MTERNIFNITGFDLCEQIPDKSDIGPKKWFVEWCDANLSDYEIKWVPMAERGSRRLCIFLKNPDDLLLFHMRWHGEIDSTYFGPYTAKEVRTQGLDQRK